jgi:uncharacterized protein (TIGR02246 family)
MRIAILVAALAAIPVVAPAQARPDSAGAVAAVEQFHAALAAGDSAKAVGLLTDDVLIIEAGAIQTRAEYLGGHLGADMKASRDSKSERTMIQVRVVGDMAYVVSKTVTPPTGAAGNTGSELAELMVVGRSGSTWRIRAVHWSSRRRRS